MQHDANMLAKRLQHVAFNNSTIAMLHSFGQGFIRCPYVNSMHAADIPLFKLSAVHNSMVSMRVVNCF